MKLRWVACAITVSYPASRHRHLIGPTGATTLCGCTASERSVWRGNGTKPKCLDCLRVAEPVPLTECICSYNTHRPPGQGTRTEVHRNPRCPVNHEN